MFRIQARIHVGAGHLVCFKKSGTAIYTLLAGGNKSTQQRDQQLVLEIANEMSQLDQKLCAWQEAIVYLRLRYDHATKPVYAVINTTTPNTMRYQANGTKVWEATY